MNMTSHLKSHFLIIVYNNLFLFNITVLILQFYTIMYTIVPPKGTIYSVLIHGIYVLSAFDCLARILHNVLSKWHHPCSCLELLTLKSQINALIVGCITDLATLN